MDHKKFASVSSSYVTIMNNLREKIKVRVDNSKNSKDLSRTNNSQYSRMVKGHFIPTEGSFTIICPNDVEHFDIDRDGKEHIFLTVLTENKDGSWKVYCENHLVSKYSKVFVGEARFGKCCLSVIQPFYGNLKNEQKAGEVQILNRSSSNVWVRIDVDDTVAENHVSTRIGKFYDFDSDDCIIGKSVDYGTRLRQHYIPIKKGEHAIFYLDIPKNKIYVSMYHEMPSGEFKEICSRHPYEYCTGNTVHPLNILLFGPANKVMFEFQRAERRHFTLPYPSIKPPFQSRNFKDTAFELGFKVYFFLIQKDKKYEG
ncbi:hypothetical protein FO519_009650 [Halicephalobus sp. NKZ332]|nr:hypothetical protein FO519_009650 [Halicephalobus sp. NKZ332]